MYLLILLNTTLKYDEVQCSEYGTKYGRKEHAGVIAADTDRT